MHVYPTQLPRGKADTELVSHTTLPVSTDKKESALNVSIWADSLTGGPFQQQLANRTGIGSG